MERMKHWGCLLRRGCGTAPAIISYITLVVGGSVALAVIWGLKHLLWGVALVLAAVVVTILEGSYREARDSEKAHAEELAALQAEHAKELAQAQANPAGTVHAPKFWETQNTTFIGSEVNNTYAPGEAKLEQKEPEGGFVKAEGVEFGGSFINVHYGPPPPLPPTRPSTSEERILLKEQLLELAPILEEVTAPWRMSSVETARQMGIPDDQFMERIEEVRSEMRRIESQVTARYVRECRQSVINVYGHARSIGFADRDMETSWQSQHGGAASSFHERFRAIAARIHD